VEFIRKNTKVLFILILPVYFIIIQSSILNKHTHFFANGLVITHSHPLDKNSEDPINNHGHTKTEICLFSLLNINFHTVTPEYNIDFKPTEYSEAFISTNIQSEYISPIFQIVPRGPPFLI